MPTLLQQFNDPRMVAERRERRRKIAAEVPDGALVFEISGAWRNGRLRFVVSSNPVRVIRHGDWWGTCLVIHDPTAPDQE